MATLAKYWAPTVQLLTWQNDGIRLWFNRVDKQASHQLKHVPPPHLFQVEVDVAAGDGGIGDKLKELAQRHRRYTSLQEKVWGTWDQISLSLSF